MTSDITACAVLLELIKEIKASDLSEINQNPLLCPKTAALTSPTVGEEKVEESVEFLNKMYSK